jgi:hypothetical protein
VPIAEQVLAADRGYAEGEAAVTVAALAPDPDAAAQLLDILDLTQVQYRWDAARVAALVLDRCRNGRVFSANTVRGHVPQRSTLLIAPAFTWLRKEGLIAPTGTWETATAPGAKSRRVRCYTLSLAGERLSRELTPMPGMDALGLHDLNRISA